MESLLRKYLGLDEIHARRKQQLELQRTQDAILERKTLLFCPGALSRYLLQEREENRLMVREYDHHGFSSYVSVAKQQLDLIDVRQASLEHQVLASEDVCESLYHFLARESTPAPPAATNTAKSSGVPNPHMREHL